MARFFKYVRAFANWPVIYLERFGRTKPWRVIELRMRDGINVLARGGTADIRMSRSVLVDQSYLTPPLAIGEQATVVDIGANIGCFALLAAARATRGRVLAFEPEPSNFAMLANNVDRNGFDRVECFQQAVAGEAGERSMFFSDKPTATGTHTFYGGSGATFRVECTSLAQVFEDHGLQRIDFLKLDCEGAEIEILGSASDSLLQRVSQIAMEVHDRVAIEPVLDRLDGLGFRRVAIAKPNYACFVR